MPPTKPRPPAAAYASAPEKALIQELFDLLAEVTPPDIQRRAGFGGSTLYAYKEPGRARPSAEALDRIAEQLDVDARRLADLAGRIRRAAKHRDREGA
jgi:hypothetical protein